MQKITIELGRIQETALYALWARVKELEQADPILVDPKSMEILNAIDYDFSKLVQERRSVAGTCLRSMVFDQWVWDYLTQQPDACVVELGAGLNTRFERVDNGQVNWFDLDLPDMMALRQQFFKASDRRHLLTGSALETEWCQVVRACAAKTHLFVAEGVLLYFSEMQVRQLLANLRRQFPGCSLIFDCNSPLAVQWLKRPTQASAATYDWGLAHLYDLEDWDSTYCIEKVFNLADLPARYLKRFPIFNRLLFTRIPWLRYSYQIGQIQLGPVQA